MFKVFRLILFELATISTGCTASGQAPSQRLEATQTTVPATPSVVPTQTPSPIIAEPTTTLAPSLSSLRVAFTNDKKIWLWQNGTAQLLTDVEENARVNLSDDGEVIAFARDGLWVINTDGSDEHLVLSRDDFKSLEPRDPGVDLNQFDWIPGTHTLLFNTIILADYGLTLTDDLYSANTETMQWRMLRAPGEGGRFIVSPDGQRVVMTTPSQISLMKIDGSDYQVLFHYHVPYPSEVAYYAKPVWASDSQSLTAAIPPEDFYYGAKSPTLIWRLPVDGSEPVVISQLPIGESGEDPGIWSPDKGYYAFWSNDSYHLGKDKTDLGPLTEPSSIIGWFSWVDESHFLYIGPCELRLGTIGAPSILIADLKTTDDCISSYDFVR